MYFTENLNHELVVISSKYATYYFYRNNFIHSSPARETPPSTARTSKHIDKNS